MLHGADQMHSLFYQGVAGAATYARARARVTARATRRARSVAITAFGVTEA